MKVKTEIESIVKEKDELFELITSDLKSSCTGLESLLKKIKKILSRANDTADKEFLNLLLAESALRLSMNARRIGENDNSLHYADTAISTALKIGSKKIEVEAYYEKAVVYSMISAYTKSIECLNKCIKIYKELGDDSGMARAYMGLGIAEHHTGEMKAAIGTFEKALKMVKGKSPEDLKTKAMILTNAATPYYRLGNIKKTIENYEKSIALYLASGENVGMQVSYNNLGYVYYEVGELKKAIENLNEALRISTEKNDDYNRSSALGNLGLIYRSMGEFSKALEYHLEGIEIKKRFGDESGYGTGLMNIGLIYILMKDYKSAIQAYKEAVKLKSKYKDYNGSCECFVNLAQAYLDTGKYKQSESYVLKAIDLAKKTDNPRILGYAFSVLAKIKMKDGNLRESKRLFEDSLRISEPIKNYKVVLEAKSFIANILDKEGKDNESLKYYNECIRECKALDENTVLLELYKSLSDFHGKRKNYKKAYEYYKEALILNENIFNEKQAKHAQQLKILHDIDKARHEAEVFRLKNIELKQALDSVKKLNEELTERNQQKNEFMAIASHDLRNPLSAIIGLSSYIKQDTSITRKELKEFMNDILISANSMLSIVKNFLNLDAIESKNFKMFPEQCDFKNLLEISLTKLSHEVKIKNIKIMKNFAKSDVIAVYDNSIVLQIFDNLISNAIKFSPPGAKVVIELANRKDRIIFSVKDEGKGLTDEDKSKVFERYAKLSAKPTAGEHSTGLGLSIVKKLVNFVGGNVEVESEYGKGAKFTVEFLTT